MASVDKLFLRLNPYSEQRKNTDPALILSLTAWKKMRIWTQMGSDLNGVEISGLGFVTPRHGGLFVSDIFLIRPEKIGPATVDMDGAAVQELMWEVSTRGPRFARFHPHLKELVETGMISDPIVFADFADVICKGTNLRNLRFAWHSHNNFAVGWSGRDDQTARYDFCPDAKWTVSLVTNVAGHMLARQDFPKLKREPVHDLAVWLYLGVPSQLSEKYRNEYSRKVGDFIRTVKYSPTFASLLGKGGDEEELTEEDLDSALPLT